MRPSILRMSSSVMVSNMGTSKDVGAPPGPPHVGNQLCSPESGYLGRLSRGKQRAHPVFPHCAIRCMCLPELNPPVPLAPFRFTLAAVPLISAYSAFFANFAFCRSWYRRRLARFRLFEPAPRAMLPPRSTPPSGGACNSNIKGHVPD